MAIEAPNYVQGQYSVTDRDRIFAKADKYPDSAGALQNQVPTIAPDGTIMWRQIPQGIDGTANANLAVVEETRYASKMYVRGDLLIYDGQLYVVGAENIPAGGEIDPNENVSPTRIDAQMIPMLGKGDNLAKNWYFRGGGSQQGGGQLPINQRGVTTGYTGAGGTIDGWSQTGGTTTVNTSYVQHKAPANSSSDFYQIVDLPLVDGLYNVPLTFSVYNSLNSAFNNYHGSAIISSASGEVIVYDDGENCQLILQPVSNQRVKIIVRVFAGRSINMMAVKLELGSISTLAAEMGFNAVKIYDAPPDYATELAKCQRYYTKLHFAEYSTIGLGVGQGTWGQGVIALGLPQAMIADYATVTITGTILASGPGGFTFNSSPIAHLSGALANLQFAGAAVDGSFYAYAGAGGVDIEITSNRA